jgi:ribosomal protein S18 acetylase RimI-like enzyme
MIQVSKDIQLKAISRSDSETIFWLMKEIYTPAYKHFWTDNGDWYVNSQYSKENILKELSNTKSNYYFILFKGEIIGNFRFIWDDKLKGLSEEKQLKLHRIYLHPKTQGKGIGKQLLAWLEEKASEKGYQIIWLDAMNEQEQAFQFYKNLGYTYYSHVFLPFELMSNQFRKMSQLCKKLR